LPVVILSPMVNEYVAITFRVCLRKQMMRATYELDHKAKAKTFKMSLVINEV
jgi:hypothetical protein